MGFTFDTPLFLHTAQGKVGGHFVSIHVTAQEFDGVLANGDHVTMPLADIRSAELDETYASIRLRHAVWILIATAAVAPVGAVVAPICLAVGCV